MLENQRHSVIVDEFNENQSNTVLCRCCVVVAAWLLLLGCCCCLVVIVAWFLLLPGCCCCLVVVVAWLLLLPGCCCCLVVVVAWLLLLPGCCCCLVVAAWFLLLLPIVTASDLRPPQIDASKKVSVSAESSFTNILVPTIFVQHFRNICATFPQHFAIFKQDSIYCSLHTFAKLLYASSNTRAATFSND